MRLSSTMKAQKRTQLAKNKKNAAVKNTIYNPMQLKFIKYYFDSDSESYANAFQSAVRAGYKEKYARIITSSSAGNSWIKDIQYTMLKKFTPEHTLDAIQDIAMQAKDDNTKLKALEMIGKIQGLFIDRQVTKTQIEFVNNIPRPNLDKPNSVDQTPEAQVIDMLNLAQ